nr:hypothetical protein [Trichocoleus desertorum]
MSVPATFWLNSAIARDPLMVTLDTPAAEVLRLMSQAHKSYVLVVDAE